MYIQIGFSKEVELQTCIRKENKKIYKLYLKTNLATQPASGLRGPETQQGVFLLLGFISPRRLCSKACLFICEIIGTLQQSLLQC